MLDNKQPQDWLVFFATNDKGEEERWSVHLNFLRSHWQCIYGKGCPSMFGIQDSHIAPDIGCCTKGAWFRDVDDLANVLKNVGRLTDEDWDDELRAQANKGDVTVMYRTPSDAEPDDVNGKTRVVDGGCIFANRADGSVGSTGKVGCAFVHMAERLGEDHIDRMPWVCWQLPIVYEYDPETDTHEIHGWDRQQWGGFDEDGTQDSWLHWWCMDAPEAFTAKQPVYRSMERELRKVMGDRVYDAMVAQLQERRTNKVALVIPPDAKTLPLYVGNRTPKRERPVT